MSRHRKRPGSCPSSILNPKVEIEIRRLLVISRENSPPLFVLRERFHSEYQENVTLSFNKSKDNVTECNSAGQVTWLRK